MLRIVGVFKKCATFATANEKRLVPRMSGLVSGLQNRVRRFESARNLKRRGCVKTLAQPFSIIYRPVIFSFVYAAFFSFIW